MTGVQTCALPILNPPSLDVIDGQQRLTTLSLFFAVLHYLEPTQPNFTNGKLRYEVRENFLESFVYAEQVALLLESAPNERATWQEFVRRHAPYDRQDVWYLFRAARTIRDFLEAESKARLVLVDFGVYVAQRVMLIVNAVEGRVSSEKIFRNLNSIKVDLTETELLKGLLLTKVGRESTNGQLVAAPREVVEIRHSMGRQWDEMGHWLNRPAVAGFFKPAGMAAPTGERLFPLLTLVARHAGYQAGRPATTEDRFPVFEYVQKSIRQGQRTAAYYFEQLRLVYSLLHDWYEWPELHNLLGFLFFSRQLSQNEKTGLLYLLSDEVWLRAQQAEDVDVPTYLKRRILALDCLQLTPADLRYGRDNAAIQDLLLLVNVFPKLPRQEKSRKFDFARFGSGSWTLEHIFPQNPDLNQVRRLARPERTRVLELVELPHRRRVDKLLTQTGALTDTQQEQLQEDFQLERPLLHGLGNLVLLDSGQNSALQNAFFDEKRRRIVQLVSEGGFVPPHTFNIFSRLLLATESGSARLWAKADMLAHGDHLHQEQVRLLNFFKSA